MRSTLLLPVCLVLLASAPGVARTIPLTVSVALEDSVIDQATMLCGLIELGNTSENYWEFRIPFYSERYFAWEIRRNGVTTRVEVQGAVLENISDPPRAGLSAGETVAMPFALMRTGEYGLLFDAPGRYDIRAVVLARGHEYRSSWHSVLVRRSNYSARWSLVFDSGTWVAPFSPRGKALEMTKFVGTQGYNNWLAYCRFEINSYDSSDVIEGWSEVLGVDGYKELKSHLRTKDPKAPSARLWRAIQGPGGLDQRLLYRSGQVVLRWH